MMEYSIVMEYAGAAFSIKTSVETTLELYTTISCCKLPLSPFAIVICVFHNHRTAVAQDDGIDKTTTPMWVWDVAPGIYTKHGSHTLCLQPSPSATHIELWTAIQHCSISTALHRKKG